MRTDYQTRLVLPQDHALDVTAEAVAVEQLVEFAIGQLQKSDHRESDHDGLPDQAAG